MGQSRQEKAMMRAIAEKKKASQDAKKFKMIDHQMVNDAEFDEIRLVADNTEPFHRKVIEPNVKNIEKRMMRGTFVKSFFVNKPSVQDRIGKEAIATVDDEPGMRVNIDTRRAIGKSFAIDIVDRAGELVRDEKPKTKFLIKRHEGEREEHQKSMENIKMMMEKTS